MKKEIEKSKGKHIAILSVSGALFLLLGFGILNKFHSGDNDIIINIILMIVAAYWAIKSIFGLKGKNLQIIKFPIKLLLDSSPILLFLFVGLALIYGIVDSIIHNETKGIIFFFLFMVIPIFGTIIFVKITKSRWTAYLYSAALAKGNSKKIQKYKPQFIKNLLSVEQLYYLTDVSTDTSIPCLVFNGKLNVFDSKDTLDKITNKLNYQTKIQGYWSKPFQKKEYIDIFQRFYNLGFRKINYITSFGEVEFDLIDLPIEESKDPLNFYSDKSLIQNFIAQQCRSRYGHIIEAGRSQQEIDNALGVATAQTNISVDTFNKSLFYVLSVPDTITEENILTFSEPAFATCQKMNLVEKMGFDGRFNRFLTYSQGTVSPFIEAGHADTLLAFTDITMADKRISDAKEKLKEIDKEISSPQWQTAHSDAQKIAYISGYRNYIEQLSKCDICVMTGAEIATFAINNKCKEIVVNYGCGFEVQDFIGFIAEKMK